MGLFDIFKRKPQAQPVFKERRLLPRWKILAPATLTFGAAQNSVPCTLLDLNFKGFAISLSSCLPENCKVLKLEVNGRYPYNVEVSPVWHLEKESKQYHGFLFVRLRDSDREKMFTMIKTDFPQHT